MRRNYNRTSSFGFLGLFTWAQIKNIAYVILPFFRLLETLFYITTKICANSMLYRLFSRIIDKIPLNEIAFFNAIYFWKKYFKDLLKIFLIELKENFYYKYLKAIILYPGLCSILLIIGINLVLGGINIVDAVDNTAVKSALYKREVYLWTNHCRWQENWEDIILKGAPTHSTWVEQVQAV